MVSNTLYILIAIFTILAIIIGPILAVQVETYLGRRREAKNLRLYVFRTLMINRKIPLSPYRIDALNLIDLYFDKDENVTKEWRVYLDLLNSLVKETTPDDEKKRLQEKSDETFIDLLDVMAKSVGYKKFDKTYIKNTVYMPQEYLGYLENQITTNRDMGKLVAPIGNLLSKLNTTQQHSINITSNSIVDEQQTNKSISKNN